MRYFSQKPPSSKPIFTPIVLKTFQITYTENNCNRSRGVQKTLYMRFHENSMKNVIDLIFLGHLKFAKFLYRFANRFPANLRTIR